MKHLIAAALTTLTLVPSWAFADEAPPSPPSPQTSHAGGIVTESATATIDTVHLRNGGMFRGRVVEIIPGDHVTLVLSAGESRRIVWAEVDRIIVASPAVPPPPSASPAAPPIRKSGPTVRVHINAPSPAYLYRRAAGTTEFVTACQAPCDAEMPTGDAYKIGGSSFTTTSEFRIDANKTGNVELMVDGPSLPGIVGGGLLTLAGGFTLYAGILLSLASSACSDAQNNCKELRVIGVGGLVLGAAGLAGGIVIVHQSLKTDLAQKSPDSARDAFVRTPHWHSASTAEPSGLKTMFPLVYEGRF